MASSAASATHTRSERRPIGLVDIAVGPNAQGVFAKARPINQTRCPVIARARIDFIEFDHGAALYYAPFERM